MYWGGGGGLLHFASQNHDFRQAKTLKKLPWKRYILPANARMLKILSLVLFFLQ